MIKHILSMTCVACALSFSLPANATILADFTGPENTSVGSSSLTVNGVTATGFSWDASGSQWITAELWYRNVPNDHGLGVCSTDESCSSGGGDVNEMSNQLNYEVILLDKGAYGTWEQLWVSSLDSDEIGTVYWGDSSDIDTLLGGGIGNYAEIDSTDFGSAVEGDILGLSALNSFDATSQYVLFTPGDFTTSQNKTTGTDNDYLVWKVAVPEPSIMALLGLGLLGLGAATKRRNRMR